MSADVSIYVELLVCVWAFPFTYCGGDGIEGEGRVDEGVVVKTGFGVSAKNSEGEKASGLLW